MASAIASAAGDLRRSLNGTKSDRVPFISMPRYYFDIHHDKTDIDRDGEDLPDQHAAWKEATVMAGDILKSIDGRLKPGHDWRMEVTDEFRNPLFVLHIAARKPH